MNHIRIFTRNVQTGFTRKYINELAEERKFNEITYGHAMHEFCYFRCHANKYIEKKEENWEKKKLADIFSTMHLALREETAIPPS